MAEAAKLRRMRIQKDELPSGGSRSVANGVVVVGAVILVVTVIVTVVVTVVVVTSL